jgi:hypothetical protein
MSNMNSGQQRQDLDPTTVYSNMDQARRSEVAQVFIASGRDGLWKPLPFDGGSSSLGGRNHMDDLKIGQVPPVYEPLLKQAWIFALHELKAAVKVILNPAPNVCESIWKHASLLAKALVDSLSVAVFEALDNHKQHFALSIHW